jgi:hypothetical protein
MDRGGTSERLRGPLITILPVLIWSSQVRTESLGNAALPHPGDVMTELVFVDECGTHTSMTRRRARAPRGIRAHGSVPPTRGPVTPCWPG